MFHLPFILKSQYKFHRKFDSTNSLNSISLKNIPPKSSQFASKAFCRDITPKKMQMNVLMEQLKFNEHVETVFFDKTINFPELRQHLKHIQAFCTRNSEYFEAIFPFTNFNHPKQFSCASSLCHFSPATMFGCKKN